MTYFILLAFGLNKKEHLFTTSLMLNEFLCGKVEIHRLHICVPQYNFSTQPRAKTYSSFNNGLLQKKNDEVICAFTVA